MEEERDRGKMDSLSFPASLQSILEIQDNEKTEGKKNGREQEETRNGRVDLFLFYFVKLKLLLLKNLDLIHGIEELVLLSLGFEIQHVKLESFHFSPQWNGGRGRIDF